MNFWLRTTLLGIILVVLAVAMLFNEDVLSLFKSDPATDAPVKTKSTAVQEEVNTEALAQTKPTEIKKAPPKKSTNSAADGLSRFYANLHGDDDGPKIRNNIVYLPDPDDDLEKILEEKRLTTRPLRRNWTGQTETHPFRLGETLFQKLSEYGQENGLDVIWWLNRDFVVKDAFRVNENIISTSYKVGKAIEGHFENGLSIYFCYKHRTIVLIEHTIPYLVNECMLLESQSG